MTIYDRLNPMQKEAVECTEGPLLILAGAGSGKTGVLTHRVAYLIEEKGINPWNIMAITFTNKAAGEMRERVDKLVSFGAESIWVSTFHSSCVRILRRHIESLGYTSSFSIYDTDDQKTLMRQVMKSMEIDNRMYKERNVLNSISSAKNELVSPDAYVLHVGNDYYQKRIGDIYREYQTRLKKNNALDFDDLIMKTVELFENNPDVLEYYQERFKYIMVDEYQDTNTAQFKLISLLAGKYKNLCVVGDDDQSIYKFRGANIGNILNFEESYPGAKVIKLEQNYRSDSNILNAANEVIKHNRGRKDKTLWTANEDGEKVKFKQFDTAYEEAEAIIRDIKNNVDERDYEECAVLYRTNAQSRLLEEKCIAYDVPYRMVGGVNFYQRKEIKDILAYLKTVANGQDDLSVLRIINVPKRGIGTTSIGRITVYASERGMGIYDALTQAKAIPGLGKTSLKIDAFTEQIRNFRKSLTEETTIQELIEDILETTGYRKELEEEGEVESQTRLENIQELINKAVAYAGESDNPTLDEFLEQVALVADIDRMNDTKDCITLMTLHSAKGLEFEYVYMAGLEDGLFPSMMSIASDDKTEIEEERRLCYVGITRAKQHLTITSAKQRMTNGETRYAKVSRFVEEIPDDLIEGDKREEPYIPRQSGRSWSDFDDSGLPWGNTKKKAAPLPFGKAFTVEKPKSLNYVVGDRVKHVKFGAGTVKDIKDGEKDYEVTVDFDEVGTKRMFAGFAKLQKL